MTLPIRLALIALCVAMLGTLTHAGIAQSGDVTGKWLWTLERPDGQTAEVKMSFEADGETVTGTLEGGMQRGEPVEIEEGLFVDGVLTFRVTRTVRDREIVQKFEAVLNDDGDELEGTCTITFGDRNFELEFLAERSE